MLLEILFLLLVVPYFFGGGYMVQRHGVAMQLRLCEIQPTQRFKKRKRERKEEKKEEIWRKNQKKIKETERFTTAGLGEQWRETEIAVGQSSIMLF